MRKAAGLSKFNFYSSNAAWIDPESNLLCLIAADFSAALARTTRPLAHRKRECVKWRIAGNATKSSGISLVILTDIFGSDKIFVRSFHEKLDWYAKLTIHFCKKITNRRYLTWNLGTNTKSGCSSGRRDDTAQVQVLSQSTDCWAPHRAARAGPFDSLGRSRQALEQQSNRYSSRVQSVKTKNVQSCLFC